MNKVKLASLIGVAVLTGCSASSNYDFCTINNVDTEIKSYDAEHAYSNVLVIGDDEFSSAACLRFESKGVSCKVYDQVFNPLKTYNPALAKQTLIENELDAVLFVESSGGDSSKTYGGSISSFNSSISGGSIDGYGFSVPLVMTNGVFQAHIAVYDVNNNEKVYMADATTTGSGSACVNKYVFRRSIAETVVDDIIKA